MPTKHFSAADLDLERLAAMFYIAQQGTIQLVELRTLLEKSPPNSRRIPSYRVVAILEGLAEAQSAIGLAVETFEHLQTEPKAPTETRRSRRRQRCATPNVIDFAAERARRGLTTVTAGVAS